MEPLAVQDLSEVGKIIQPKLYKEAALVLNLVQMYLILERILMITCTMAANYYANSAKDVKADAVALKQMLHLKSFSSIANIL
jgi:hypothetical protein